MATSSKSAFSEVELHAFRLRLLEGLRHKAARGELRISLPVGYVWGEAPGEVRFDPDEEVVLAIRQVFARFAELEPGAPPARPARVPLGLAGLPSGPSRRLC